MLKEEDIRNAIIAKLACVGESVNEKEVKWNSASNMTRTIEFSDDTLSKVVVKFYRKDGTVFSETEYVDLKKHGTKKAYYPNGNIKENATFVEGKKASSVSYFDDGRIQKEAEYQNGRLSGIVKIYARHTKAAAATYGVSTYLREVISYKYGNYKGLHAIFHANGQKLRDTYYNGGYYDYQPAWIEYDKDGNYLGDSLQHNNWHSSSYSKIKLQDLNKAIVKDKNPYVTHKVVISDDRMGVSVQKLKETAEDRLARRCPPA